MSDRFYLQQGATVTDFVLGDFGNNKPTKAQLLKELSRVLPFVDAKSFTPKATVAVLQDMVNHLKSERLEILGEIDTIPPSRLKKPYIEAIVNATNFDEESLTFFSGEALRDFISFIKENKQ